MDCFKSFFFLEKISRKRCTTEEKSILEKAFYNNLNNGSVPKKAEIVAQQEAHPVLKMRPCQTIQKWIANIIKQKNLQN